MLCTWQATHFSTLMMFVAQRPVNIGRLANDPASAYVAMAVCLAESLRRADKKLRVFTNDPDRLVSLSGKQSALLQPEFLPLDSGFPEHLAFYAAHHKLNIFKRFADETWPNGFLDLDMVLSKDSSQVQRIFDYPEPLQAWVYNISSQVFPAFTRTSVQGDLQKLGTRKRFPSWYGGEFIVGIPAFHVRIAEQISQILPTYLATVDTLHHVGDESVLSVAINNVADEFSVGDAGDADLVVRYWSGRTHHMQPPAAILDKTAFWHLPDMKWALSRQTLSSSSGRLRSLVRARQLAMRLRPGRRNLSLSSVTPTMTAK